MEHVNGWCFRGIYKGGLWEEDLHVSARLIYIEKIAAENKYLEKENTFPDRFYDRQVLHCYSFHEPVPRQCRFRIPNSISKRIYRIKG